MRMHVRFSPAKCTRNKSSISGGGTGVGEVPAEENGAGRTVVEGEREGEREGEGEGEGEGERKGEGEGETVAEWTEAADD